MPAFWGVVRSLPKREAFAAERLRMDGGFEVFLPQIQTKRTSQPLFPSYLFARIVEQWRSINYTLGVLCLVRVGDCPARLPRPRGRLACCRFRGHREKVIAEAGGGPWEG